jgi:hypothetical protein
MAAFRAGRFICFLWETVRTPEVWDAIYLRQDFLLRAQTRRTGACDVIKITSSAEYWCVRNKKGGQKQFDILKRENKRGKGIYPKFHLMNFKLAIKYYATKLNVIRDFDHRSLWHWVSIDRIRYQSCRSTTVFKRQFLFFNIKRGIHLPAWWLHSVKSKKEKASRITTVTSGFISKWSLESSSGSMIFPISLN